jgi:hypothetical protein
VPKLWQIAGFAVVGWYAAAFAYRNLPTPQPLSPTEMPSEAISPADPTNADTSPQLLGIQEAATETAPSIPSPANSNIIDSPAVSHSPSPSIQEEAPSVRSTCAGKRTCSDMRTCSEAHFYWTSCGLSDLDRDDDGIPCEDKCGKTLATMGARLRAQPFNSRQALKEAPLPLLDDGSGFDCKQRKTTCGAMNSCEEATFYLEQCRVRSLDRDRDGIACESLCR